MRTLSKTAALFLALGACDAERIKTGSTTGPVEAIEIECLGWCELLEIRAEGSVEINDQQKATPAK